MPNNYIYPFTRSNGARYYNPRISQFYGVDPLAAKYPTMSPFTYTADNPVLLVDPTGMGSEENEWIPKVDENGNVSYKMEDNDSVKTLQTQYGLSETQAQQIMPADLKPGEAISGTTVKMITGSEVLKLDRFNNKQKNLEQFIFASDYERSKGNNIMKMTDYFADHSSPMINIELDGYLTLNNKQIHVKGTLPFVSVRNAYTKREYNASYGYSVYISSSYETGGIAFGSKPLTFHKLNAYIFINGNFRSNRYNGLLTKTEDSKTFRELYK